MNLQILIFFTLFTLSTTTFCQSKKQISPEIRTYTYSGNDLNDLRNTSIRFPIVVLKDTIVRNKINQQLLYDFQGFSDGNDSNLDSLFANAIAMGLYRVDYEIGYDKHNLLSIKMEIEACGAYCSSNSKSYLFDLANGEIVKIEQLIKEKQFASFHNQAFQIKRNAIAKEIIEIQNDSLDQEIRMELAANCLQFVNLNDFFLSESQLVILDSCQYPHYIRCYEPSYSLSFELDESKKFLNRKYLK